MIPFCPSKVESLSWQRAMVQAVTSTDVLFDHLKIPLAARPEVLDKSPFPLRVPLPFINRMKVGQLDDPLLRQVLPITEENVIMPNFSKDPLQEQPRNHQTGVIQKYPGRVLLILSPQCAIHCRYCFRRHFPYEDNRPGKLGWKQVFQQLKQDTSIYEVILSGGDPFSLSDKYLAFILNEINAIKHIKFVRFHTRFPVVIPQRIDASLLSTLQLCEKSLIIVLHINHPQEINQDFTDRIAKLIPTCHQLFNQAVLLHGVNDTVDALKALSFRCFESGILPYYLHVMDTVAGAHHFTLPETDIYHLYHKLQAHLPGYLLPKLVREIPGQLSKTLLSVT